MALERIDRAVGALYALYAVAIVIAMGMPDYIPGTIIGCLSLHFGGLLYGWAVNKYTGTDRYELYPDSVSPWAQVVDFLQGVAFIFTILHVSGGLEVPLPVLYVFCGLLLIGIFLCWKKVWSKMRAPYTLVDTKHAVHAASSGVDPKSAARPPAPPLG